MMDQSSSQYLGGFIRRLSRGWTRPNVYLTLVGQARKHLPSFAGQALEPNISRSKHRSNPSGIRPLTEVEAGQFVRIVAVNGNESNNRLMGMGLIPGVVLQLISSKSTGSVIVAIHNHRLGLGLEMAACIEVELVDAIAVSSSVRVTSPASNSASNSTSNSALPQDVMSQNLRLSDAAIGATLKVLGYAPTARDYKRKLLAMGLTPGTEFTVKRHAPLGDPTEIEVRGFRLSLRKAEADALMVGPIATETSTS